MSKPAVEGTSSLVLIHGEDEFAVKERAKAVFSEWRAGVDGMDQEIIDAAAGNSSEAIASIRKVREALNTLPFFGGVKLVWLQNCTYLGDDRTAASAAVTEALGDWLGDLKALDWSNLRLLISAGKVDRRKAFYKNFGKLGETESYDGLSANDSDWAKQAQEMAEAQLRREGKRIGPEALARLVTYVGPNSRQIHNESFKLAQYCGDRAEVSAEDVDAIVTRNKQSKAFALGDALGSRDLGRTLRCLDEEVWEMKMDRQKSEIGLLYGLIAKVRSLVLAKEMTRQGWLRPERDFRNFRTQLAGVPEAELPEDKRYNPLKLNPYVLFVAVGQARNYTMRELIRAMDLLLECNRKLIFSSMDATFTLQQSLIKIIQREAEDRESESGKP